MRNPLFITSLALLASASIAGYAKKPLDHDAFDSWQSATNYAISANGEWESYAVNPQEGDGVLTFYNTRSHRSISIERGYRPAFTPDGRWGVAMIRPHFADTRQAKIDKKKDHEMPADSLAIVDLASGKVTRIGNVLGYKVSRDKGHWIAYQSCDTALVSADALADKKSGRPLVVADLSTGIKKIVNWVKDYSISDDGTKVAISLKKHAADSLATDGVGVIMLPDTSFTLVDRDCKFYGAPVLDREGRRMAYTASDDSIESGTRKCRLMLVDFASGSLEPTETLSQISQRKGPNLQPPHASDPEVQAQLMEKWGEQQRKNAGETYYVNQYSKPVFSYDGRRIVTGVVPYVAPDDTTIVDFERATLDIWRWDAPYTPPQELSMLDELKKATFPVVTDIERSRNTLLTTEPLATIEAPDRWDADWALLRDPSANIISRQWDYFAPETLRVVNVTDGGIKTVADVTQGEGALSPLGKYVLWFDDRQYHCYNIATGTTACISESIEFPLWDEDMDMPSPSVPYGVACWSDGDKAVMVYDRFDIWRLDPDGKKAPECLTASYGRDHGLRLRYVNPNPEDDRYVSEGTEMMLSVFDYADKRNGLATLKYGKSKAPEIRMLCERSYRNILKARDAEVYSWISGNFSISPDVYVCRGLNFAKAEKLSSTNPQMADYSWGTAELVKWYAYNGKPSEGVLYKPGDFDPSKKYPMLAVFYETNSENLYAHYNMEPSWSWVNYPFYASRGYVIFVPDIHYTPGLPGESAWTYVCSGVEELCKRHDWIDKEHIGIDGQSWGGYQTAYLVTRTDMFACAGSGAPVANMTSAFGGIRWGSGDSRQAQYEQGQSRIGRNLWEAPELYIANSPLFHADRCHTPLLIMHNDEDGAVPWYQGIEMFMALRRLHRPVWMLQYNDEAHNLRERRNRKDITIRLQQFFDHYLKGAPMPEWMKQGIPAIRKGQEWGTGLTAE